jgi:tRNA (guanine37-N1)-methyltransferase
MQIDILTIFPEIFSGFLDVSMIKIAREKRLVDFRITDIREFAADRHKMVDDRPFGGGPGMVMKPEPIFEAVEHVLKGQGEAFGMILTPRGTRFNQRMAQEISGKNRLVMIAGRYEGIDERVHEGLGFKEVSIGDYVLFGGEVAAMVVCEAVIRLIPGVLGAEESTREESFAEGYLEYPQYTRPRTFRGMTVPEVLLSGDHARIKKWRAARARELTEKRRGDLVK